MISSWESFSWVCTEIIYWLFPFIQVCNDLWDETKQRLLQGYYLFILLLLSICENKAHVRTAHKPQAVTCPLWSVSAAQCIAAFSVPWAVPENVKFFVHTFVYMHKKISPALGPHHMVSSITVFYLFKLDLKCSPPFSLFMLPHQVFPLLPLLSQHVGTISSWYLKLIILLHLISSLQSAEPPCNTIVQVNTDKEEKTSTWGAPVLRLHRTEVPHKKGKTNRSACLLIDFLKDTAFISSAQHAKIRRNSDSLPVKYTYVQI